MKSYKETMAEIEANIERYRDDLEKSKRDLEKRECKLARIRHLNALLKGKSGASLWGTQMAILRWNLTVEDSVCFNYEAIKADARGEYIFHVKYMRAERERGERRLDLLQRKYAEAVRDAGDPHNPWADSAHNLAVDLQGQIDEVKQLLD